MLTLPSYILNTVENTYKNIPYTILFVGIPNIYPALIFVICLVLSLKVFLNFSQVSLKLSMVVYGQKLDG